MQTLINEQALQTMRAMPYEVRDNIIYSYLCKVTVNNVIVNNELYKVTINRMRVKRNTIVKLTHNINQNLYNNASFLQALNALLNTQLQYHKNVGDRRVELIAVA